MFAPPFPHIPPRPDVQGLRAIAVLAVILFHVNKNWLPGGFIGVDVFLVISGFLITSIVLYKKQAGQFSFKDFYLSRIRRIIPAYMLMLVVVTIGAGVLLIPQDFKFYKGSLNSALYFASNRFFSDFSDYFAPAAHEFPLLHTWSLAVEMQFYLLMPLLIMFVPNRYLKVLLPALVILLTAYAAFLLSNTASTKAVYFSLPARIPEFLLGSCLALYGVAVTCPLRISNLVSGLGLSLIVGSSFYINEATAFPGLLALAPCLGVAMILAVRDNAISRALSVPILVWIGALSYSLYLWHWPVLALMRYHSQNYELTVLQLCGFSILTFGLAYGSYKWIEKPFRERTSVFGTAPRSFGLAALVLLLPASAAKLNSNFPAPLPSQFTRYAPQDEICHGQIFGDCHRGRRTGTNEVLVLGDSHAAQLNYFFDVVGEINGFGARIITASSCVTIPGFDVERIPESAQASCVSQIKEADAFSRVAEVIVVAGMWQYHYRSDAFIKAFKQFLAQADAKGKRVLILAQIPMLSSNALRSRRFSSLGLSITSSKRHDWFEANAMIADIVSKYQKAVFLDLSSDELFKNAPFEDGVLLYLDEHHLNEVGARRYGQMAAPYIAHFLSSARQRDMLIIGGSVPK